MNLKCVIIILILTIPVLLFSNKRLTDEELLKKGYKAIKRKFTAIHASKFKPYFIIERTDTSVTIGGTLNVPSNYRGGTPVVIIHLNGKILEIGHGK